MQGGETLFKEEVPLTNKELGKKKDEDLKTMIVKR